MLDPFIASGVAQLPDNVIDLMDSDSEEEDKVDIVDIPRNAKDNDAEMDMLLYPLDELLQMNDDERLLKIMSLAMQNEVPSNLVTLCLNGHLHRSHVLNFIRTSVKNR